MDWDAIGAIGELVSAAAVVVSLLYLGVQLRAGSRTSAAAARQQYIATFDALNDKLIDDDVLQDILVRGMADLKSLNPSERRKLNIFLTGFLRNIWKGLLLHRDGLIDDATLSWISDHFVATLKSPGGAQWWEELDFEFDQGTREYLDQRLQASPFDALDPETLMGRLRNNS